MTCEQTTAPSISSSGKLKGTRPSSQPPGRWSWSTVDSEVRRATNPDFSEMWAALCAEGVSFLVVCGHAVMQYTEPRYTKDLDLWVRPDPTNAERVYRALSAFGAPMSGVSPADFEQLGTVFIGVPPNRIDVLTSADGVTFDDAWATRVETSYGEQTAWIPSAEVLIRNKRACGRPQDLLDVLALERALARR